MTQAITTDNLQEFIDSGKPVVIDFWAEWCGPCRMISPIIDEMANKYADQVIVGKCDIESNDTLAVKYGVRNIPTIIFLKGGEIVEKQVGASAANVIEDKIKSLL